ncbi:hypothetical protein QJS10_CPA08g00007 [Acorus calamus]|uniref:Uncharacterized protein n=1 Tax=Acorus calamus TaxID=4465 RepID=A0AAV9E915_ACOCL|nr:hypothetical protein QJS10_CPA08g00007 [Acorus calamus]
MNMCPPILFFRKKKLTTHWRRFIHPLMWRCKWLELQMRELHSQASKYDKELLEYDLKKQNNIIKVASERSAARLVPHTTQNHRRQVMKRRKRKRSEDMVDVTAYMTRHNLFSFYENGRLEADGLSVDDDFGDQSDRTANCADDIGDNQDSLVPEFRENDSLLEQILLWIDALQSRVHKLKIQLDKAVFRNSVKRSSTENLHLLTTGDLPASSAQSPTSSHVNVDTMPVGSMYTPQQHSLADVDMEELVLPGSAVSSYEEVNSPSHMIDNSMDPLSIDEISLDDPHFRELYDGLVEDVLINNEADEEDLQDFENLSHPHLKKVKQEVLDLKEGEGEVKHLIEEATAIAAPVLKRCLDAEFGNLGCESSGRDAMKTEESQVIDDR